MKCVNSATPGPMKMNQARNPATGTRRYRPRAVSAYSVGPTNANTMRNDRAVQLISNSRLMAGPNPVRYSSIMWTSSAATVRRNPGRMISGSSGRRRYVRIHITSATRLDPPTITTGGTPMRRYPAVIATATNSTAASTLKICTRFDVSIEPLVGQRLLTMFVYVNGCWPIRVPSCGGRRRAPLGRHQGSNPGRGPQALRRLRLRARDHSGHRPKSGGRPGAGDALLRYQGEAVRCGGGVRSPAARPGGRAAGRHRLPAGGAFPRSVGKRRHLASPAACRRVAPGRGRSAARHIRHPGHARAGAPVAGPRGGRDQGRPGRHADAGNGAVPLRAPAAAGGGPRSRRGDPLARPNYPTVPDGEPVAHVARYTSHVTRRAPTASCNVERGTCNGNGAEGARTPDLLGAIQALSQLSYSPVGRRNLESPPPASNPCKLNTSAPAGRAVMVGRGR